MNARKALLRNLGGRSLAALLLWWALVLPVLAGLDRPDLPQGAQQVRLGPAEAEETSASSSASSAGASSADSIEDRLRRGQVQPKFIIGGNELTTRELLAQWDTLGKDEQNVKALQEQVSADAKLAGLRLAVDYITRNETKALDAKYIPLQAVLAGQGSDERSPIAVFDTYQGTAETLAQIYNDSSKRPRRLGFTSRIDQSNTHSVAGDLYVDPEADVVSLVLWDSMPSPLLSTHIVTDIETKMSERGGGRLVTSHKESQALMLFSGCWQCALRFVEDMLERDHHAEQIAALPEADPNHISIMTGPPETADLSDTQLALFTSKGKLINTLVDMLLKRTDANEFAAEEDRIRELLRTVQQERQERRVPGSDQTNLYNLRIDRLRADDLRAISEQLQRDPDGFLAAARDQNRLALEQSVTAGQKQQAALRQAEERQAQQRLDDNVSAPPHSHESTPGTESMSGEPFDVDYDQLLSDSDEDSEHGFLPTSLPASHEEQRSRRDKARNFLENMFAEVEREAAEQQERVETERSDPMSAATDREE